MPAYCFTWGGIQWGGDTGRTWSDFYNWLVQHGQDPQTWAANHPCAFACITHLPPPAGCPGSGGSTPHVTGFSPTSGGPGTTVLIQGDGFSGATQVSFGSSPSTNFTVQSGTQIAADVPVGAQQTFDNPVLITVIGPGGEGIAASDFIVSGSGPPPPPPPVVYPLNINHFNPSPANPLRTLKFNIIGGGFLVPKGGGGHVNRVDLIAGSDGKNYKDKISWSIITDTQIKVTLLSDIPEGIYIVVVNNNKTSSSNNLTMKIRVNIDLSVANPIVSGGAIVAGAAAAVFSSQPDSVKWTQELVHWGGAPIRSTQTIFKPADRKITLPGVDTGDIGSTIPQANPKQQIGLTHVYSATVEGTFGNRVFTKTIVKTMRANYSLAKERVNRPAGTFLLLGPGIDPFKPEGATSAPYEGALFMYVVKAKATSILQFIYRVDLLYKGVSVGLAEDVWFASRKEGPSAAVGVLLRMPITYGIGLQEDWSIEAQGTVGFTGISGPGVETSGLMIGLDLLPQPGGAPDGPMTFDVKIMSSSVGF